MSQFQGSPTKNTQRKVLSNIAVNQNTHRFTYIWLIVSNSMMFDATAHPPKAVTNSINL